MTTALNFSAEDRLLLALLAGRAAVGMREEPEDYASMSDDTLVDTFLAMGGNGQIEADDFALNLAFSSGTPTVAEHLIKLMIRPEIVEVMDKFGSDNQCGIVDLVDNTVSAFDRAWPGPGRAAEIERAYESLVSAEREAHAAFDARQSMS